MENKGIPSLSNIFMKDLQDAIEKQSEDKFQALVYRIPLSKLPYEETNKLFLLLLNFIENNDFVQGLKIVLKYWSGMEVGFDDYVGADQFPILSTLFLDSKIPVNTLRFIMVSVEDVVSVEEVAIELIEKATGPELKNALKNLFDILGEPSGETFRILMDESININNSDAIEFFSGLQAYFMRPADKPSYVETEEELPQEKLLLEASEDIATEIKESFQLDYEDLDGLVDFLTSGLKKYGVMVMDLENVKENIRVKLSGMNIDERKTYMNSFLNQESFENLNANTELFQILGPVNPIVDGDFTKTDHICYKYGGCRMFYCNCFESDWLNPEDENKPYYPNIPLWFTGVCETCGREVQKRCYAVRRPLPQGGWRGTYCSWNCLYDSGNVDESLSEKLCKMTEKRLKEEGILDREEMNVEELLEQDEEIDKKGFMYRLPIIQ
jgi:hypothetical protein